jgi:hypothetical protein
MKERNKMIQKHTIETGSGKCFDRTKLPFLTDEQFTEFNNIGYSGKISNGTRTTREEYLNTLGIGEFSVEQTKYDNGDFSEAFLIIFVPSKDFKEPIKMPQMLPESERNIKSLAEICEEYVEARVNDGRWESIAEYFEETVLYCFYGNDIYDKLNNMTDHT